jgi:hypothetical protein
MELHAPTDLMPSSLLVSRRTMADFELLTPSRLTPSALLASSGAVTHSSSCADSIYLRHRRSSRIALRVSCS